MLLIKNSYNSTLFLLENLLKMAPFFSVIIPLYNKEKYIEDTLRSVLNQTFQDFEIIIINDGSTDKSLDEVVKFNDDRITIFKQKNAGVSVARNKGIELAKSKYIALLDADDFWHNNHLLELKKQILQFPDTGLYCNNYQVFYTEKVSRPANFNFNFDSEIIIVEDFFKASIINSVAWTSAIGFSKEKFNKVGGFNTHLKTAQDLDLWIRFALKYKVSFNPVITMSYKLYIYDSLSKSENEYNHIRYNFISSFSEEEKTNSSLKLYLDINRYALAIRTLMNNNKVLYKKLKQEIDFKNLNLKQRILLYSPDFIIQSIKKFQRFLIKNKLYLTAYN